MYVLKFVDIPAVLWEGKMKAVLFINVKKYQIYSQQAYLSS